MSIYFAQAGAGGPIKIGYSDNPSARVSTLKSGVPYEVIPLGMIAGEVGDEADLHVRFATSHLRAEWFRPTTELLAFIEENAEPFPVKTKTKNLHRLFHTTMHVKVLVRTYNAFVQRAEMNGGSTRDAIEEAIRDWCLKFDAGNAAAVKSTIPT